MAENKLIDFPVGDDPRDVEVLLYWEEVARRIRLAPLQQDVAQWADVIQDRIDEYRRARVALSAEEAALPQDGPAPASYEDAVTRHLCALAEFPRLKAKLSVRFLEWYPTSDAGIHALFGPRQPGPAS